MHGSRQSLGDIWYSVFLISVSTHAPLKCKWVKHPKLPPWLNKDIKETMAERDKLNREIGFLKYKKLRNLFGLLYNYVFTKGHRFASADVTKNLTAYVFNNYFLSVPESLIEPRTTV